MKLQAILSAAKVAVALLGTTALTAPVFAVEVPAGTKLAADQIFNYRVLDNINALDPDIVEDVDTSYVVGNLFEGLYNEDAKGNPVPGAAESYDVNADNTVYTFHLRDAKWSNGDPVKASDFVYQLAARRRSEDCVELCLFPRPRRRQECRRHRRRQAAGHRSGCEGDRRQDAGSHAQFADPVLRAHPRARHAVPGAARPSSKSSAPTGPSPKISSATAPTSSPRTRPASASSLKRNPELLGQRAHRDRRSQLPDHQ